MKKLLILSFLFPIFFYSQNKINYDIYSHLINERINESNSKAIKLIVINDSLIIDRSLLNIENHMDYFKIDNNDPIYDSLPDFPKNSEIESLINVIATESKIISNDKLEADNFRIIKPLLLTDNINKSKLKKSKDYWKLFYKLYPNSFGIFHFSPVFYSGRLAAVYIAHSIGGLSGTGYLMIMQKKENVWKICIPYMLWIS